MPLLQGREEECGERAIRGGVGFLVSYRDCEVEVAQGPKFVIDSGSVWLWHFLDLTLAASDRDAVPTYQKYHLEPRRPR